MPVAPICHSGCQVQVAPSLDGSDGASNQPLGVRRSIRPSPLTSPEPTPCPAARVPKSCFVSSNPVPSPFFTTSYHTTTLTVLGKTSGTPSPERSTVQAA